MPFESPQYDMEEKLAFFREFGYVIFEQLFDPDLLDQVDENMRPLIDTIVNRERPITTTYTVTEDDVIGEHVPAVMKWDGTERALYVPADAVPGTVLDIPNDIAHRGDVQTGHGRLTETHRYNLNLPWREPFAHPHFYENPRVLDFLERYWESDRFSLTTLYVNIPGPGTRYQRWHRDGGADFYDFPAFVERPDPLTKFISKGSHAVGLKFATCDTTIEQGAIEIVPGSHRMEDYAELGYGSATLPGREHANVGERERNAAAKGWEYNRMLMEGRFHDQVQCAYPAMRLTLKKGDAWIQDPRIFHRGTPNISAPPVDTSMPTGPGGASSRGFRPELQISYRSHESPSPFRGLFGRELTPEEQAGLDLSERGEILVVHARGPLPDPIIPPELRGEASKIPEWGQAQTQQQTEQVEAEATASKL